MLERGESDMYFRYTLTTDALQTVLDRTYHKARVLEYQIDDIRREMSAFVRPEKLRRLKIEEKLFYGRYVSSMNAIDHMEEELEWRGDPQATIDVYRQQGYKLVYICGNREFSTKDLALSEARFLREFNEVKRELGTDGSWVDDMCDVEDMIHIQFV